jgi:hypothetical protein
VARTVNVSIMTLVRLILHVSRRDRDSPLTLLRGVVDRIITIVIAAVNVVLP